MHRTLEPFKTRPATALVDATLKIAIERTTATAERKRAAALSDFPEFDAARDRGRRIKDHVIANLDHYLIEFERNAKAAGTHVHWAATADDAARIVIELCRAAQAKRRCLKRAMALSAMHRRNVRSFLTVKPRNDRRHGWATALF